MAVTITTRRTHLPTHGRRAITSVTLDLDQVAVLDRIAKEQRISRSSVVRQAIQVFVRLNAHDGERESMS